jgi:alpha-L-rhamnosidase
VTIASDEHVEAAALDRPAEVAQHRALHSAIRAAFIDSYVFADGTVEGGTQTGYLLALAFDLLPPPLVPAAVNHLAADIEKRGNRLSTGFVGVGLLGPMLSEHGRADLAYALLHQEGFPSWGYTIRHGATTIWERWDGWTEHGGFQAAAMNSFNHYSLGSVGDWLFGRVAGIDLAPSSVAYRELLFRPLPGGRLRWARAEQETVRGTVACGWSLAGGRITVTVTVPPGCTALLELPTSDPDGVREADERAAGRPGVPGIEPSAAGVTVRLTSVDSPLRTSCSRPWTPTTRPAPEDARSGGPWPRPLLTRPGKDKLEESESNRVETPWHRDGRPAGHRGHDRDRDRNRDRDRVHSGLALLRPRSAVPAGGPGRR